MRPHALSLLAILGFAASAAYAESGDASDQFLDAFLNFQKGEKAETRGDARGAVTAYNRAIDVLDGVSSRWPDWNPAIVKHRRDKAAEGVARLQPAGSGSSGSRPAPALPVEPDLPAQPDNPLPPDSGFPAPSAPTRSSRKGGGGDPIQEIQSQIESLRNDLSGTKERLEKATQEKEDLAKKYDKALRDAKEMSDKMEVVQKRADRAETALLDAEKTGTKSSTEVAALRKEAADAKKALRKLQIERDAEAELNEQFAGRIAATRNQLTDTTSTLEAARKESADARKQLDQSNREKGELQVKLSKVQEQMLKATSERDEALVQLGKMKEATKNVDKLLTENTQLMAKLQDAEMQISTFKVEGGEKDKKIAELTKEVTTVRSQFADVLKQSADYQTQMNDLRKQLDTQAKELTAVKTETGAGIGERKKLADENDLLRGIVLRQQKEQARRDRVKKLVLEQFAKMEIHSKALSDQVELLGSPVVNLTDKERRLFKEPQLSISDTDVTFTAPAPTAAVAMPAPTVEAKIATPAPAATPVAIASEATPKPEPKPAATKVAENKVAPEPAKAVETAKAEPAIKLEAPLPESLPDISLGAQKPDKNADLASAKSPAGLTNPAAETKLTKAPIEGDLPAKDPAGASKASGEPGVSTAAKPAVPPDLVGLAREAKDHFERGNYRDAEKIYDKALAKAPNNLYVLSNLGVVRFRQQKYKLAEEAFKKAIAVAPEDDFSHCTLGIVFYQQGKFDDAIQSLTRALAINAKNPTAHNYLGITASQKGWQEAAQKELETATAIDPTYADAHFNLAVVFATQSPPNKDEARKHYKRAVELGAEADSALEQLIK